MLLGDYHTDQNDHVIFDVATIEVHESYSNSTLYEYDFCMIKLAIDVDFQTHQHIRPICLPTETTQTYAGFTGIVTGWGQTSFQGSESTTLQEVEITVLSNIACR